MQSCKKRWYKSIDGKYSRDDILSGYRRHQALSFESTIDNIPKFLRKSIKNVSLKFNGKAHLLERFKKLSANIDKSKEEKE